MKSANRWEASLKRMACKELFEGGLKEGPQCPVCRCWRRPCAACAARRDVR